MKARIYYCYGCKDFDYLFRKEKLKTYDSRGRRADIEALSIIRGVLGERAFKFIYCIGVNVFTEKIFVALGIDGGDFEHRDIFSSVCEGITTFGHVSGILRQSTQEFAIDVLNLGGGLTKIVNNRLIFYGDSYGLGKYEVEYLKRVEGELKKMLGVDAIEYQ